MKHQWIFSAVPIYFHRSRDLIDARTHLNGHEERNTGGSLVNLRYVHDAHWFGEITTGFEIDSVRATGTDPLIAARAGVDDCVLVAGYRSFIQERGQLVVHGLIGIPTRRSVNREDRYGALVGSRLYNLGFGFEESYSFINELQKSFSFIMQQRFIHAVNRGYYPVLPRNAELQPGNSIDLLATFQYRHKRTIFEAGYDATLFTNQAIKLCNQTIKADTFVRHSGYLTVTHAFAESPFTKPFLCGAGLNCAGSHQFNFRTITAWIHATFVF